MQLVAICDKFPDLFEVYQENEDSVPIITFVCVRKNSRSFQSDQQSALRWLEAAGLNVKVRVGTINMSLDEFDQNGAIGIVSSTRPIAQSTYYMKRVELKRLERSCEALSPTDPQRELFVARIAQLKKMLGLADDSLVSQDEIKASNDRLNHLIQTLQTQQPDELPKDGAKMEWKNINAVTDDRVRLKLAAEKQFTGPLLNKVVQKEAYTKVIEACNNMEVSIDDLKHMYTKAMYAKPEQGENTNEQPTITTQNNPTNEAGAEQHSADSDPS